LKFADGALFYSTTNCLNPIWHPLDFNSPVPEGKFSPCVMMDKHSKMELSAVPVSYRDDGKRRKTSPNHTVLENLWASKHFCDLIILCAGREFHAHRAVLGSVSPVWQAMLTCGMQEAKTHSVTVNDASEKGLEEFLRFCYLGSFDPRAAINLLPLAVKYEVPELSKHVASIIAGSISMDNAKDIMPHIRAIRLYRENPAVSDAWSRILDRIKQDGNLLQQVLDMA